MNGRIPLTARAVVRIAGYFVPAEDRAEWRDQWRATLMSCWSFLRSRPEISLNPYTELLRYSARSLPDAWGRRTGKDVRRWPRFLHGPHFPLAVTAALLVFFGALTGGFSGLRSLLLPPPYAEPGQLVTLWQDFGALSRRVGIPAATLRAWQSKSALMGGFAAYYQRRVPLSRPVIRTREVREVRVTPEIFEVLGVKPLAGRSFAPLDAHDGGAKAVLGYALWRDVFDGDPGLIGETITLDGQPTKILGVMPRGFWFPNQTAEVWAVLPLRGDAPQDTPYLLGAIARLKPGIAPGRAQEELRRVAAGVHIHWNGSMVRMSGLHEAPFRSLQVFLWAVPLAVLCAILAGRLVIGRKPWRFWIHFAVKTGFVFLALSMVWVEYTGPRTISLTGWIYPGIAWISIWWFVTTSILLVWWSIRDQRWRCPVCCGRLVLPVTIGSYSSPILDPVSTELMCERGHGVLYVPGGLSTNRGEWRALDSSWQELFR
jgi:hypothetical protein